MNLFSKRDAQSMTIAEQFVSKVEQEARSNKIRVYAPMILLVFMTIVFSIYDSHFFSMKNLINVLGQMAVPLILATGLTFVLLLGRIDLSVEGVMGLVGSAISLLVINSRNANDWGVWGVILPLLLGTLCGFITGFLHVKLKIASFIITYAISTIVSGVAVLLYNSRPATVKAAASASGINVEKWSLRSLCSAVSQPALPVWWP